MGRVASIFWLLLPLPGQRHLGRNGHFDEEKHWGVEAAALYWHYVDVIWVFFYPALYLIGTAA